MTNIRYDGLFLAQMAERGWLYLQMWSVKGRTSRPTPSSFRWGDSWVFLRSHSHHFKTALGIEWMRRRSWLRWQSATTIIDFMYGTENQITSTFTISGAFCARLTFTFTLEDLEEAASSVWVGREAHSTQKLKKPCNFLLLLHIRKIPPQQKRIPETKSLFATMPIWPFHWALFGICHCYQLLSRSFLG